MLTAYPQHCNCVYSMRLAVPLSHDFCFIQWVRACHWSYDALHLTEELKKSVKCFYLLFSATSVCLVLSNLPSLKEVIRSNMQYKNTICSHCQPWDETILFSIHSGKAIETAEFHRGLGILIDDCLFLGTYIQQLFFFGNLKDQPGADLDIKHECNWLHPVSQWSYLIAIQVNCILFFFLFFYFLMLSACRLSVSAFYK